MGLPRNIDLAVVLVSYLIGVVLIGYILHYTISNKDFSYKEKQRILEERVTNIELRLKEDLAQ